MKKLASVFALLAFVCLLYLNIAIGMSFALSMCLVLLSPLLCWFIPLWVLVGDFSFGELFLAELKDNTYYGWFLNIILMGLVVTGFLFYRDAQSEAEKMTIAIALVLFYAFIMVKYFSMLYGITLVHSLAVLVVNMVMLSLVGAMIYALSASAYKELGQSDVSGSPFLTALKSGYTKFYEDRDEQKGSIWQELEERISNKKPQQNKR